MDGWMDAAGTYVSTDFNISSAHASGGAVYKHAITWTAGSNPDVPSSHVKESQPYRSLQ
jgi:hypothetical protein